MMNRIDYLARQIEEKYDPEHDIPDGPEVTWVDAYLLEILQMLQSQVNQLTAANKSNEIKVLEKRLEISEEYTGEAVSLIEDLLGEFPVGQSSPAIEAAREFVADWYSQ